MYWQGFEQWQQDIINLLCAKHENAGSLYSVFKLKFGANYLSFDKSLEMVKEQVWLIEKLMKDYSNVKPLFSDSAIMSGIILNTINELNKNELNKINAHINSCLILLENACKIYAIFKEQKQTGFDITKYL